MAIGPTVMGMAGATSQEKPIHYLAPSHYAELFRSTAESSRGRASQTFMGLLTQSIRVRGPFC
jgi:hypothetical protein